MFHPTPNPTLSVATATNSSAQQSYWNGGILEKRFNDAPDVCHLDGRGLDERQVLDDLEHGPVEVHGHMVSSI